MDRVGTPDARLTTRLTHSNDAASLALTDATLRGCISQIVTCLHTHFGKTPITAIGHRLVRGGPQLADHQRITSELIAELRRNQPLDLDHLPNEISLIEGFSEAFPEVPQVACFDTVFHRDLPRVAQLLPIPRRFLAAGVRRLGFHGLSYTYLMSQLTATAGPEVARGRVILAHLGSGASMAAVHHGNPIDTTMAFTPTAGLVMGTRPGDLDPGLLLYLMKQEKLSPDEMESFISHECGLLGVSETHSDMRDLIAARDTDPRAADAFNLFCYQAKKHLCALVATLGGLDTLVFAGGIGEHSPETREAICAGLDFLGLELDATENTRGSDVISRGNSRVGVRVIHTDEEVVISRIVRTVLQHD